MSDSMTRRRRWPIVAPLVLFLVICVAWSAVWFYAARTAEAALDKWIAAEARHNNIYSCGQRSVGGYPFRLEVRCVNPVADLKGAPVPVTIKAADLLVVAQIYQPNHVILQMRAPFSVDEPGRPGSLLANWSSAEASVRGRPDAIDRVSVVFNDVTFSRLVGTGIEPLADAKRLELHGRTNAASAPGALAFDLGARFAGGKSPLGGPMTAKPTDGEVSAVLTGIRDLRPRPLPDKLREWQAAGGKLEINGARVQQESVVANAKGTLALNQAGRIDGALDITLTGFERLAQALGGSGDQQGRLLAAAFAGLAILSKPVEIEGKRGASVPLRFTDGNAALGPVKVGQIPALF